MNERDLWECIYRGIMQIATAILKYKLKGKAPDDGNGQADNQD